MKLQDFLSFKSECSFCKAPIVYKARDFSDQTTADPTNLEAFWVIPNLILKLCNSNVSLFFDLKRNTFTALPHLQKVIIVIEISGHCQANEKHYEINSQHLSFLYDKERKGWPNIPNIEMQEIIGINQSNIFSIINSYKERETTVVFMNDKNQVKLPLIKAEDLSQDKLLKKIKTYITFS